MRVRFLTNLIPYPLHGGVQLRVFNLARRIAQKHQVTVDCKHIFPSLWAALHGRPPETAQYQSPLLQRLVRKGTFEIIEIEETLLAPTLSRGPSPVAVLASILPLLLLVFSLRRYVLLFASFVPRRPLPPVSDRSIAVRVAARNEA